MRARAVALGNRPSTSTARAAAPALAASVSSSTSWLRGGLALGTAVVGGSVSGGLHAISGPDHLAALLPRCLGQRWWRAARIGTVWGIGHGISVTAMVLALYALKGRSTGAGMSAIGQFLSRWTECAIGVSLIAIGLLGLVEARQGFARASEPEGRSLCAASNDAYEPERRGGSAAAILLNGMLCGLSWDGAPSFAPALAMASWGGALLFVAAYNFSTIVVMSACVSLIGEGTRRSADSTTSTRNLPLRLSLISSLVAVGVGLLWALKGVLAQR